MSMLILIRHGESEANVAATAAEEAGLEAIAVPSRDADVPLTALGELQALSLGRDLIDDMGSATAATSRVWSSPYRRAVMTAELALPGLTRVRLDERLRDRELGVIDAMTSRGVEARMPDEFRRRRWLGKFYYRPPGGESWADLALRIRSFVNEVDWAAPEPVIIFAHDAVVSLFLYVLLELTEDGLGELLSGRPVSNASITRMSLGEDTVWVLDDFADDSHLLASGLPRTDHQGVDDVSQ